jgi:hypothetical protein
MKKFNLYIITVLALLFSTVSCLDKSYEELLTDPDQLPPEAIDINAGIYSVQESVSDMFDSAQDAGAELTRLEAMVAWTYAEGNNPGTASGAWNNAYTNILPEINLLIKKCEQVERTEPIPMLKVLKAYTLMLLVDMWGDVPYSQALQGVANLNPATDTGSTVYGVALTELNEAITLLAVSSDVGADLFYGGNAGKWRKLAKTLKFKYYLNIGNATELQTLLTENDMLNTGDDFYWKYNSATSPDSRHPDFTYYIGRSPIGTYSSNYLMWTMLYEKTVTDPRVRYYIYRQRNSYPTATDIPSTVDALPCSDDPYPYTQPGIPFCALPSGYWGRDHGNGDGIPPDGNLRATYGIYPAGGRFDANQKQSVKQTMGYKGAGISPIMMSSFVDFMVAEAILKHNLTGGNAATYFQNGVSKSINFVKDFGAVDAGSSSYVPSSTQITNYINYVVNAFNTASSTDDKMSVLGKEYWIALYGNGYEAYNLYRRTGKPANLQPMLGGASAGAFPKSLYYTIETATLNTSINQKPNLTQPVFWDTYNQPLN